MGIKRKILLSLLPLTMILLTGCPKSNDLNLHLTELETTEQFIYTEENTNESEASTEITSSSLKTIMSENKATTFSEYNTNDSYDIEQPIPLYGNKMNVHIIDVGQGDSIFIELPNTQTMLIDAGENEYSDKVITYIYSLGYDTIDYVIASHPHSDHIGGMDEVINTFNINNFYMTSSLSTTKTYEDMLIALKNSTSNIYEVMSGYTILNEDNLLIEVVAPKEIVNNNHNNNSIVIKLTYDDSKFLFAGDAEKAEEDSIWTNIKSDVLKLGHHGSKSSSSPNFLKKVNPTYAVISVGSNNSYGHPDNEILKILSERNIQIYRTDQQGTIIFTTDGKEITVNTTPYSYKAPVIESAITNKSELIDIKTNNSINYVLNTNTKKIHLPSCSSVNDIKEKNKSYTDNYEEAITQGYTPCKRCNPET